MDPERQKDNVERLVKALTAAHCDIIKYSSAAMTESTEVVEEAGLKAAVYTLQTCSSALLELINTLRLEATVLMSEQAASQAALKVDYGAEDGQ